MVAENVLFKTNIRLKGNCYNGIFMACIHIHGKVVNIPCKAADLFREAKNCTVFPEAVDVF